MYRLLVVDDVLDALPTDRNLVGSHDCASKQLLRGGDFIFNINITDSQ